MIGNEVPCFEMAKVHLSMIWAEPISNEDKRARQSTPIYFQEGLYCQRHAEAVASEHPGSKVTMNDLHPTVVTQCHWGKPLRKIP